MVRYVLFLIALLCAAQPLMAGAWQREKGAGFASASARFSWPTNAFEQNNLEPSGKYYTLYLEYGLTDRLTGGLDLGRAVSGAAKSIAFLQFPLRNRDNGPKISVAMGLGQIDGDPVLRPGLAIGTGIPNGWLSAESFAEIRFDTYQTDFKLDVTWGRNVARDRKLIVQLQTGAPYAEDPFIRLAPSIVFPVKDRLKVEVGGSLGVLGDDSFGVLLGLWTDF